jgi:hypothetical protein
MDELTLEDKKYISSKRAAQVTGYAKDYIGQLCREGKVEATQLGRNWYVLETSIKEHRFGVEEMLKTESLEEPKEKFTLPTPEPIKMPEAAKSTWQPTSYTPQVLETLPEMPAKSPAEILIQPSVNEPVFSTYSNNVATHSRVDVPAAEVLRAPEVSRTPAAPVSSDVIAEMQSAWQDWFAIKNQDASDQIPAALSEELLESPAVIDSRNENELDSRANVVRTAYENYGEEEIEPVRLYTARESASTRKEPTTLEIGDEHVPLHRTTPPASHVGIQNKRNLIHSAPLPKYAPSIRMQKSTLHEARIIRERRVVAKKPASYALRALFVVLALISVAIAVDGTGHFDSYLSNINSRFTVIGYLGGESIVNKP